MQLVGIKNVVGDFPSALATLINIQINIFAIFMCNNLHWQMSFAAVYAIGSVYNLKQAWPGTEVTKSSAQPRGLSVGGECGIFGDFETEQTKFNWVLQGRSLHFPFPSLFVMISVQTSCEKWGCINSPSPKLYLRNYSFLLAIQNRFLI